MTDEISTGTFECHGQDFHLPERVGLMPMMKFAVLAKQGESVDEMEGLAATYELLRQCIHPSDWVRFEQHVTDQRLDHDELLEVVGKVMVALTDRPTGRSSDSSAGPRTIEPSSTDDSSSPAAEAVIHRFNEAGRPDLALVVRKRQESLTA